MLLADRSNYDIVHVRKKIISIPCLEVGKYSTFGGRISKIHTRNLEEEKKIIGRVGLGLGSGVSKAYEHMNIEVYVNNTHISMHVSKRCD